MSRSVRRVVTLFNKRLSEKEDKKRSSKKIRRVTRLILSTKNLDSIEASIFPISKEAIDNYYFTKDDMRVLISSIKDNIERKKYSSK